MRNVTPNIALFGPPGTGKTYIGRAWCDLVGARMLSFADALKSEVAEALGGSPLARDSQWGLYRTAMGDPATKDRYRGILQWWGTDFRRADDPDYWARQFEHLFRASPGVPVAVDDCRFPNEYSLLVSLGFRFVRLKPGETTRDMAGLETHESERHWPAFPVDIVLPYVRGPEDQARRLQLLIEQHEEENPIL